MLRSINELPDNYFENIQMNRELGKLTFGLCYFHAII